MRHPRRKNGRYRPRRQFRQKPLKRSNEQAIILSGLNVLHVLENYAPKYLRNVLYYGPDSFVGDHHATAVIWYRRKGYPHYQTLKLFGVWVTESNDLNHVIIGSKSLNYSATVYNAESYHTIIQQTFVPYYGKDTTPPSNTSILFQTPFDITQRLALRKQIASQLEHWFKNTLFT